MKRKSIFEEENKMIKDQIISLKNKKKKPEKKPKNPE